MAKILLVEDDNNLREIYEARLMAEGYDIVSARDGEEALTVAMKERPDLIISDVMMPKISGFDMLDIIRSTEETKNAKVIMMTALSQAEDKERATKLGADRYLVKSQVTLEDVAKVAREVLAGESDGGAPAQPAAEKAESTAPPAIAQTPTVPTPDPTPPVEPSAAPAPVVPAPAPEPSATTPAPEPAVAPVVVPAPTVDPAASTPAPEPASPAQPTPTPPTPSAPAAQAVAAAPTVAVAVEPTTDEAEQSTEEVASKAMEAIMPSTTAETTPVPEQPVEDEQSAIAAQIESFIETSKTGTEASDEKDVPQAATPTTPEIKTEPTPEPVTESVPEETEKEEENTNISSGTTAKKVIQPISDPNASKGPDLENLLKKEEEKQQMQEIAKTVAAGKADVADERVAEAALKKAAVHPATPPVSEATDTPQVAITENGDLEVKSEPKPEAQQATQPTEPVIPHQNGGNIDGVVQPTQSTQQTPAKDDPNAIAL